MNWMCNFRFIVVFVILVIMLVMFSMSEPFQKYLYGRTKEGFGLNNQLVRMWNEPAMEGKWSFTYPTRKEWPLKDMKISDKNY